MRRTFNTREVKTRTNHACALCGYGIPKGQYTIAETWAWKFRILTAWIHHKCDRERT